MSLCNGERFRFKLRACVPAWAMAMLVLGLGASARADADDDPADVVPASAPNGQVPPPPPGFLQRRVDQVLAKRQLEHRAIALGDRDEPGRDVDERVEADALRAETNPFEHLDLFPGLREPFSARARVQFPKATMAANSPNVVH